MCGIAGYFALTKDRPDGAIENMTRAILHRGPDSAGHWRDDDAGIALGMRRLAVLDLTPAGEQPMTSECGRYVVVFNGEIYNHRAIRKDLESQARAPRWRGHSDTEVLVAAIAAWGVVPALKACNGMLGLAVWDRKERTLYLAIDRFGEKPLYFGWCGRTFLFGSELKALAAHPGWSAEIDRDSLAGFMRVGYILAPRSIYSGIAKLEPGTIAVLRTGSAYTGQLPEISTYWSVRETVERAAQTRIKLDAVEITTQFEALLSDAVGLRMESDVPLGAFLSGGFDSTAVVVLMQRQSSRPVRTFTIGFEEQAHNEAPYAKAVAERLGTAHTEFYVSPQEAIDVIPRLPAIYDEPFADSSQIPTFLVSELARRHVTVSLSGDGGDEMLGGYARYSVTNRTQASIARLPMPLRKLLAGAITSVGPANWDRLYHAATMYRRKNLIGGRAMKFSYLLSEPNKLAAYKAISSLWQAPNDVVLGASEPFTPADRPSEIPEGLSFIEQMMFLDIHSYLPGDILTKVDRATMAVSLEGRIPFLDPRIMEFAWRLPMHYKVRGGIGKWLLREIVYRHVPRELMDRPKSGFSIPIQNWLRGRLRPWAESLLQTETLEQEGLSPEPVLAAWQEHRSGASERHFELWNVLMYLEWRRAAAAHASAHTTPMRPPAIETRL